MNRFFSALRSPAALRALAYIVVPVLIPPSWILSPLLPLMGFGPLGPLGGSLAAWLQSHVFGAAVGAGSWFAGLQAAGMGVVPAWVTLVAKGPLVVGGMFAAVRAFFRRGA